MRYFQGKCLFFGRKQRYYAKLRHFCKWEVSITPKNRQKSSKNHLLLTHFRGDRQLSTRWCTLLTVSPDSPLLNYHDFLLWKSARFFRKEKMGPVTGDENGIFPSHYDTLVSSGKCPWYLLEKIAAKKVPTITEIWGDRLNVSRVRKASILEDIDLLYINH